MGQQRVVLNAQEGVALIRLHATLIEITPSGQQLVAQRSLSVQRPATSADAAGDVRALTQATDAAIDELDQWLRQVQRTKVPGRRFRLPSTAGRDAPRHSQYCGAPGSSQLMPVCRALPHDIGLFWLDTAWGDGCSARAGTVRRLFLYLNSDPG